MLGSLNRNPVVILSKLHSSVWMNGDWAMSDEAWNIGEAEDPGKMVYRMI